MTRSVLAGEAAALVTLIEATGPTDAAIASRQDDAAHRTATLAASRQANSAYGAAILESSHPSGLNEAVAIESTSLSPVRSPIPTPAPVTGSQVSRPCGDS